MFPFLKIPQRGGEVFYYEQNVFVLFVVTSLIAIFFISMINNLHLVQILFLVLLALIVQVDLQKKFGKIVGIKDDDIFFYDGWKIFIHARQEFLKANVNNIERVIYKYRWPTNIRSNFVLNRIQFILKKGENIEITPFGREYDGLILHLKNKGISIETQSRQEKPKGT